MGWTVYCDEREVWSPALQVGFLFLDEVRALERLLGRPSGIWDRGDDTMEIDAPALEAFIQVLLRDLERTNNGPWFALVEGCLKIMIALNARITGRWPEVSDRLKPLIAEAQTVMLAIRW